MREKLVQCIESIVIEGCMIICNYLKVLKTWFSKYKAKNVVRQETWKLLHIAQKKV